MHLFSKVFSAQTSSSYTLNTACFNVDITPMDKENYYSTVDVAELGNLTLGLVHNRSSVVCRKHDECGNPESKRFTIAYAVNGELTLSLARGAMALKKGEFVLIDNSEPRKMFVYNSVTLLLICVTQAVLQKYITDPEGASGQILQEPVSENGTPLFAPLLSLWEHLKSGELEDFYTSIGEELLQEVGVAFAKCGTLRNRSRHHQRLVQRIRKYIESNLGDCDLSIESVAAEFQISSRYLRSLFQDSEKLSSYILRRRIEESAKLLTSPLFHSSSITEIAHLCGFNSSSHFARCFRAHYKESARDFRQRHLRMEGAAPSKKR